MPVYHDGALFYLGDSHASQGDTEYTGTAAETCGTVRLHFELIKQKKLPFSLKNALWLPFNQPAHSRWRWTRRRSI